ncbi:response regulator [Spirulina sp. CS-785/01]|uniref:response regulator n=1 Tax=Spirulina sp. CS-785/01 TaxID=3021716 RepID=UPI0023312863|nr:response regulator [Spirulina sp. CS-785/01]MDB9313492.1 response regulator [Spirulina sp. CS-785/01]
MAEQLTRYLGEIGLKTIISLYGEEALSLALNLKPQAILLDLRLPELSGWTILEKLQNHPDTRQIPVIVISIEDEPSQIKRKGVQGYLVKPIQRSQLYTVLSQVLSTPFVTPGAIPSSPPVTPPRKKTVSPSLLIAHEDQTAIDTLWEYLNAKRYHLSYAQTGEAVIEQVKDHSPDLILLKLPVTAVDGLKLIQQLRGINASIPIIVLTASTAPEENSLYVETGATVCLSKPVRLQQIAHAIAAQL